MEGGARASVPWRGSEGRERGCSIDPGHSRLFPCAAVVAPPSPFLLRRCCHAAAITQSVTRPMAPCAAKRLVLIWVREAPHVVPTSLALLDDRQPLQLLLPPRRSLR
jgi:hypothetical protein